MTSKLVKVPKEALAARRERKTVADRFADLERDLLRAPAPLAVVTKLKPSPASVYLDSLNTDSSRATMRASLEKVAKILAPSLGISFTDIFAFPWHKLDIAAVSGLRKFLVETNVAISSANLYLSALKGVLRMCAPLKLMTYEEMHGALVGAKRIRGHMEPKGRALPREDVEALVAACDTTTVIGQRDAAMIVLFFGCGLRKAEVAKATIGSLTFQLRTSSSLLVEGKGRKQRRVFLSANALKIVEAWLEKRGDAPGPILLACDPNHDAVDPKRRGMGFSAVYKRVVELAKRAGIAHVSPHDLRRTYITDLLKSGTDLLTTSRMVGHAGVATTEIYDRRGEEERQAASDKFQQDRFAGFSVKTEVHETRED